MRAGTDPPGTGRMLLNWIEECARQDGVERMRLDCSAALGRYYEAAGYHAAVVYELLGSTSTPRGSLWFCYEKSL